VDRVYIPKSRDMIHKVLALSEDQNEVYRRNRGMNIDLVLFADAIADETRQEIMKHLCCVWLSVNDVVERLEGRVKQPTVSHHLKKLEDAQLVQVRQEGRQRFYTFNEEYFTVCCGGLITRFAPTYTAKLSSPGSILLQGTSKN
jgi:ArsR family transcriptional regulator, arsenate/arsenite/antimonite-responsive transcriptional repressor